MEVQTTLVSHESKSGTSQRGPWTRHTFTDPSNVKYQTFDQNLANQGFGLLNQPVVVTFEHKQNGEFTNNDITSIRPAGVGAAPVAAAAPQATAPTSTAPANANSDRARELRIMRQSALERAIQTVGQRIVAISHPDDLFALSERYVKYFAGGPSAIGIQSQAATPPPAAGGDAAAPGPTQAPAAAPVAAEAPVVAPNGPDDDIPF